MVRTKFVLVLVLVMFLFACNNKGTEVQNPYDSLTIRAQSGSFLLDLPAGWSYTLYSEASPAGEGVYTDPLGSAETLALLEKDDSSVVILAGDLPEGETLVDYVNARKADADETDYTTEDGIEMMIVNQAAPSENGGSVNFIYATDGDFIVVLRLEIVASTLEEAQTIAEEFMEIGQSISM